MTNKPTFEDIANIPDSVVPLVKGKRPTGRPKSAKRVKAEQIASQKEFIENYESIAPSRVEPKRMVVALSLPREEQKQALEDAMQPRQLAFCKEYVIDFNKRQAGLRAGYSPKNIDATTYNLMQYRGIRRLIEIYTESNAEKVTSVDPEYVIQKVTEIIATSSNDSAKLRGLELLARHLGMFIERTEITGKDGEAIRFEETRKEADSVARQLREMGKKTGPVGLVK